MLDWLAEVRGLGASQLQGEAAQVLGGSGDVR